MRLSFRRGPDVAPDGLVWSIYLTLPLSRGFPPWATHVVVSFAGWHFSDRTPDVQQKMWDTLSPSERAVINCGPPVNPNVQTRARGPNARALDCGSAATALANDTPRDEPMPGRKRRQLRCRTPRRAPPANVLTSAAGAHPPSEGHEGYLLLMQVSSRLSAVRLTDYYLGGAAMPSRIVESLTTTPVMSELFSDQSVLTAMLAFEVGLARAEAGLGVIPASVVGVIEEAGRAELYNADALAADSLRSGTASIPLVKALTERVRAIDPSAAGFVHWGATSQDVTDTAIVLILRTARDILHADLTRLESALYRLSEQHAGTVMLGRTLLQAALPTTFGLKVAGWLGAVRRNHARLHAGFEEAIVVQLGGAAGTLASLGNQGIAVGHALARELGLRYPEAPWHTHRDRLATLMCAFGVMTGSLGKMARDISLLAQNELAEVTEPAGHGRGGSSTMPHKQNPVGCALTLAAAFRVPGLVATFLSGMVQEHERAVGGWQAEWSTIGAIVQATGLAISTMVEVTEGLHVNIARMRENIDATRGTVFAEQAMMLLAEKLGRDVAYKTVEEAVRESIIARRDFVDVLAGMTEVTGVWDTSLLKTLRSPEGYLGMAEDLRRNLVSEKRREPSG